MAELFDPSTHPHRRFNPLTNEHILVSPHRNKRPWLGQTEPPQSTALSAYDPECYLCPGNARAGGQKTDLFEHTMVFTNDYAAPVSGDCDVLIFHPRHDLTLARLQVPEILRIIDEWISVYKRRGRQEGIKYVQIFENKGAIMGCSNPHPHGQVWSTSEVPTIPATELASLARYAANPDVPPSGAPHGPKGLPCLLCEYTHFELGVTGEESRVVVKNEHWVALVPWWATWPFEILLLPHHRHVPSLAQLTVDEKTSFAEMLSKITKRYDNLFSCSFAYSMGVHQRPLPAPEGSDDIDDEDNVAHLHLHFFPPLLRSASVRKFLVGYELMAEAQRDLTPEQAAQRLRACSEVHYIDSPAE